MPYVIPIISAVLSSVSAIAGGVMAYQGSVAQAKQLKYSQAVLEQQAKNTEMIADKKSEMEQYKASQDAKQLQRKYMVLEGSMEAARAGSGIGGGSVSEGDIATDIFKTQKVDEMTIRHNADLASWNIREEGKYSAWAARAEASGYGLAAKDALKAGKMALMSSILFSAPASGFAAYTNAGGKVGSSGGTTKTTTGYQAYGSPTYTRTFTGNTAATYKTGSL